MTKPKLIFHPLAQLHVAVTECYHSWIHSLLFRWRVSQRNEECKRLFLRLKYKQNEKDIHRLKKYLIKQYGNNSYIHRQIMKLEKLYLEQANIYKSDNYYRSIHWESDENTDTNIVI